MEYARGLYWGTIVTIVAILLVTGPVVGVTVTDSPPSLGDGDAVVADVSVDGGPAFERGRFATGVTYLRMPDARITVSSSSGSPRLILRTEAPALDTDASTSTVLPADARGTYELSLPDRPYPPGAIKNDTVTVRTTVRVQSYEVDRTLVDRNETLEVDG